MGLWAVTSDSPVALVAKSSGSSGGGSSYGFLVVLALLGVAFYLFILRPQRSRMRKAQEQQQRDLDVGARVLTASGMYGTVAAVEDDAVLLEVAPGVMTRWARGAIGRVVEPEETFGVDGTPPTGNEEPDR